MLSAMARMAKAFFLVLKRFCRQAKAACKGLIFFWDRLQSWERISVFSFRMDSSRERITGNTPQPLALLKRGRREDPAQAVERRSCSCNFIQPGEERADRPKLWCC